MKTAVVLFNLGGPDSLKAVRPFLFNLFNDAAIITLPQPLRFLIATMISLKRARKARGIYRQIGGKSPILQQTVAQAEALEKKLCENGEFKVFVSMRHWHPMSRVVAKKVKAYKPDHIVLLPLYPQFSTTTTGSAFDDWQVSAKSVGLKAPSTRICCYPEDMSFVAAQANLIRDAYWKASENGKPRVLFSAHGLPEKIIAEGDPYQWQVERSAAAIRQIITMGDLDYSICYQSRVGRLQWIGPSTEEELVRAGKDKVPVVLVPISFVSEHSETLVELDIEYRHLAEKSGVPGYWRVPALGVESHYIESLANLCLNADRNDTIASFNGARYCQRNFRKCPCVYG